MHLIVNVTSVEVSQSVGKTIEHSQGFSKMRFHFCLRKYLLLQKKRISRTYLPTQQMKHTGLFHI